MENDTRCIFCLNDASTSRSVEHIIPQSLGNLSHVLPAGIVCDRCNNYFARKVEKPLLDSGYFTALRFHESVPNKRGRIPTQLGMHRQTGIPVTAYKSIDGSIGIDVEPRQMGQFLSSTNKTGRGELLFPVPEAPPIKFIERFMAKCALEILAQRVCWTPGWRAEAVIRADLGPIRRFARYAEGERWPVHIRRIYACNTPFPTADGELTQVVHEYDLLYSDRSELYAVVAIFGVEMAINLGGPEVDGYKDWLKRFDGLSPLYTALGRFQS